jgi:uncharacterized protein DUF6687
MRYVPYHRINAAPNIIVDGAPCPGTVLTLSHWPHSGTPTDLLRDTSAEIAFAHLDSPADRVTAIVSNNHFDQDGLVGIYVLVHPDEAQANRNFLIDVATAGDFGVYKTRAAARVAIAIASFADRVLSPLPASTFDLPYPDLAGHLYKDLLELLPGLAANPDEYRKLWEDEDAQLEASEELIERGHITIDENAALDLAVVHIPTDLPARTAHRFTSQRLTQCHPFAIASRTSCARLLLIQGRSVEFQYRYESWVQYVSRRPLPRVELRGLVEKLNQEELGGRWVFDGVDKITPSLHFEASVQDGVTSLSPEYIRRRVEHHLASGVPAWNPYDAA